MEKTRPGHPSSPRLSAWIVVVMVAMVALPAALALATVRSPVMLQMTSSNPTPTVTRAACSSSSSRLWL